MSRLKQAYFKVTGSKLSQLNHPNALTFLECLLTKQIFLSFHSNDHYLHFTPELWVIPLLSSIEFVVQHSLHPCWDPLCLERTGAIKKALKIPARLPCWDFTQTTPLTLQLPVPVLPGPGHGAQSVCALHSSRTCRVLHEGWYKSIRDFLLV